MHGKLLMLEQIPGRIRQMTARTVQFDTAFEALTDHRPLRWQGNIGHRLDEMGIERS